MEARVIIEYFQYLNYLYNSLIEPFSEVGCPQLSHITRITFCYWLISNAICVFTEPIPIH